MMYMYMCVSRLLKYSLVNDMHVSNNSAVARVHKIYNKMAYGIEEEIQLTAVLPDAGPYCTLYEVHSNKGSSTREL